VGYGKVGKFLPVNNLRLRRSAAANLCSSAIVDDDDDGALAERYRPNCHQQHASTDCVYNANHVDLKARSHCGD